MYIREKEVLLMKAIFEEYGFVILAAVVILLLVGMATPIGNKIQESIESVVDNMTTQVNNQVTFNNLVK